MGDSLALQLLTSALSPLPRCPQLSVPGSRLCPIPAHSHWRDPLPSQQPLLQSRPWAGQQPTLCGPTEALLAPFLVLPLPSLHCEAPDLLLSLHELGRLYPPSDQNRPHELSYCACLSPCPKQRRQNGFSGRCDDLSAGVLPQIHLHPHFHSFPRALGPE